MLILNVVKLLLITLKNVKIMQIKASHIVTTKCFDPKYFWIVEFFICKGDILELQKIKHE